MKVFFAIMVALLSGCASTWKVITDDPVRSTNILRDKHQRAVLATISLDSSRRNVIVGLSNDSMGKFCAEPPPDTASSIRHSFNLEGKGTSSGGGNDASNVELLAKIQDTYESTVVALASRTERLDIYRTGTYWLCQMHLNSAASSEQVFNAFELLTRAALLPSIPIESR